MEILKGTTIAVSKLFDKDCIEINVLKYNRVCIQVCTKAGSMSIYLQ